MAQWVKVLAKPDKPEFRPWDPHDERREWTPANCPLIYSCTVACVCPHIHTLNKQINVMGKRGATKVYLLDEKVKVLGLINQTKLVKGTEYSHITLDRFFYFLPPPQQGFSL